MLLDQRLRFDQSKSQISSDGGFTSADHRCGLSGPRNVAVRDPRRASRMQDLFRSGASAEIDDADVAVGKTLGGVDAWLAESGHRGGDLRADIRFSSSELSRR
jgi:hypothetical protein